MPVALAMPVAGWAFDLGDVAGRAKALAAKPYKKPDSKMPESLSELTYEQYRGIHFRQARAAWRGDKLPFDLTFMHRGGLFVEPVRINEVVGGQVRQLGFDPTMFDYGALQPQVKDLKGMGFSGFSGFRLRYPVNSPRLMDDIVSFQGASYFRAMGKGQGYGLSARGIAIDTAWHSGEEFPSFTEFWLEKPAAGAQEVVVYALMDSARLTGAYRFVIRPGTDTVMDVKAQLFFRKNGNQIAKLGVAPLTSMFFFGENQQKTDDYRPEAHDSDGLSVQTGEGEWIWRPLINPRRLLVTSFATKNPKGFGLMQRDRSFSSYEDLDNHYEARPSAWVEPKGNWGAGRVELVQIPTPDETNDNIVAYWVPEKQPQPGEVMTIEYQMRWQKTGEKKPPVAAVQQTRLTTVNADNKNDAVTRIAVDFAGDVLTRLPAQSRPEGVVDINDNGKVISMITRRNPVTRGWRLELSVRRVDESKPVELWGYLREATSRKLLSETWSYILPGN